MIWVEITWEGGERYLPNYGRKNKGDKFLALDADAKRLVDQKQARYSGDPDAPTIKRKEARIKNEQ